MAARIDGRVDYTWTVSHTDTDGSSRVMESGSGRFGTADSFTGHTHNSYTAVGAAIFDDICEYVTENHRFELLDARIADETDPVEVAAITVVVRDSDGVEKATLTGMLNHQPVTDDEVAEHLIALSQAEIDDERRRFQRSLELEEEPGLPLFEMPSGDEQGDDTLDDETRAYIGMLRETAADMRAEVNDPDFCREQLARAETDLARGETSARGMSIDLLQSRVDRWRRLLEISAEAYIDAAALDAAAEHARRSHCQATT